MNLTNNTTYSVTQFIQDLLKVRFAGNRLKQEILESGDKLNFACPYCGDSAHDSKKKRGNYWPNRDRYRCYNDGCGASVTIEKFIAKWALKYGLDVPNREVSAPVISITTPNRKRRGSLIELLISGNAGKYLLSMDYLATRFSLMPVETAPLNTRVGQFISTRNLNVIPTFNSSCWYDASDDKIYIFNLDLRSNKVLGFAIRRVDDWSGPKYLIKTYSELVKNGLVKSVPEDIIVDIDSLNNYFNIMNIQFNQPIVVTEGQFDSMFIDNAIATTGVSKSKLLLDNLLTKSNTRILFDSDFAGKSQSLDLLDQGYLVFLWNLLFYDLSKKYKVSRSSLDKIKDPNDLFNFIKSREPAITLAQFNSLIAPYYSNSQFDILWV